ncbi:hypothetical protein KHQ81_02930 [Mycoplasmatota bacterium]|nr:hypothetical protein KHQ81_02930 [Mycoplasmatota bacterium]
MDIVVKFPIEDGMRISIADSFYRWIKYEIYNNNLGKWLLFIIYIIGLLLNVLSPLLLLIIVLFNKRIRILFLILPVFGVLPLIIFFVGAVLDIFVPYLVLYPILRILIFVQLIINLNFSKYRADKNTHVLK